MYFIQFELGNTVILPASSCLCALSVFRFFFVFKIFKGITKWSSAQVEYVCEKHGCKANSSFAFKVMQKEHPFLTLVTIFFLTCVCFGFSLRIIEQHYWEIQEQKTQDWSFEWNAVWCIFVSMTTVGYGDFYPRTHFGRIITLIASVVGIYFISMMTLFMTKQSILNESEYKAYKLITRLKLRKEIKQMQSKMVFHCLNMSKYKSKMSKEVGGEAGKYEVKYSYERRCVITLIEKIKNKQRAIKTFEFMPTKEQLFDVCERVDNDIKEIKNEIKNLELINSSIVNYADSQIEVAINIQKNIHATKLLYKLIHNNEIFDKLNNLDCDILSENETPTEEVDDEDADTVRFTHPIEKIRTVKDPDSTNDQSIILNYDINPQEIKAHFASLFLNVNKKKKKDLTHTTNVSE